MTIVKVKELMDKINTIVMQPFAFNELKITVIDVIRAKHPKNWIIPAHFHPWFEFNYVAKGSLYTTIDNVEFLVSKGQSYIIPPGVFHSHRHNSVGDDGICIRFDIRSDKENSVSDVLKLPHRAPFCSDIERLSLCGGKERLCAQFAAWLMGLYDLWAENEVETVLPQNTFVAQVELYLKEYRKEKIKTDDVANAMNVSYRTLARRFKAETGLSVFERLTEIRLDYAKRLLLTTDLPIYEVASNCGFESEFYFSRHFKAKEGLPPTVYRTQYRIDKL